MKLRGKCYVSKDARLWSIFRSFNIYSFLALAGVVGPIVIIVADLTAAISQPGYDPIRDSISSLVWSPMGWLQTIGFLTVGLLVEVFVAGLLLAIRGGRVFNFGIGLLICFGFGLLLIGAFPTDPIGNQYTIGGTIHDTTAKIIFIIFPVASLLVALSLRKDSRWKGLFVHTIATSGLALALVIGWLWLTEDLSWFGLYERILVANTIIWVEIIAIRLLRFSLSAPERLKESRAL
jgi:hypothetical membrane protein